MTAADPRYDYPLDDIGVVEREARLAKLVTHWDNEAAVSGISSIDKAVHYSHELLSMDQRSELYYHAEAFYKNGREREALIFMNSFMEAFSDVADDESRSAIARVLLWRGLFYASEGKAREALDDLTASSSTANEAIEVDQAVIANALYWRASIIADIAYQTGMESEQGHQLSSAAVKFFEELNHRFKDSEVGSVRAVLARASYYLGHLRAITGDFEGAVTAFNAARGYSEDLEKYFADGFREVCAMRTAALRAVEVPLSAAGLAFLEANLQYLKSIDKSYAREMARLEAHATAHGRLVGSRFPATRARVESVVKLLLVPFTTRTIMRKARFERVIEENHLRTLAEAANLRHAAAAHHIHNCQIYGQPLVLFLRNFGLGNRVREGEPPWASSFNPGFDRTILEYYIRRFGPIVVISDRDTTDADTELPEDALVLYLPDDSWKTTLRGLIRLASLILINAPFVTDSLRAELQIVSEEKQSDLTILIAQEMDRKAVELANIFSGRPERTATPVIPSDFEDQVAVAVHSSEPPSAIESSERAKEAIDYVVSSLTMPADERFLHMANRWKSTGKILLVDDRLCGAESRSGLRAVGPTWSRPDRAARPSRARCRPPAMTAFGSTNGCGSSPMPDSLPVPCSASTQSACRWPLPLFAGATGLGVGLSGTWLLGRLAEAQRPMSLL